MPLKLMVEAASSGVARGDCLRCRKGTSGMAVIGARVGSVMRWMHIGCFKIPYYVASIDDIEGHAAIAPEDHDALSLLVAEAMSKRGDAGIPLLAKQSPKPASSVAPPQTTAVDATSSLYDDLSIYSNRTLKAMLVHNDQSTAGTKDELVSRVTECLRIGCLPLCPTCHRGHLRPDGDSIRCPGWFEGKNYKRCAFRIPSTDLPRSPFKDIEGKDLDVARYELRIASEETPKKKKTTKRRKVVADESD